MTLHNHLAAADQLGRDGKRARVLDFYSLKPIDTQALVEAASATGDRLVVTEDHYPAGGIGSAVFEAFNDAGHPVRISHLAARDLPGSGTPEELMKAAGISADRIAEAAPRSPQRLTHAWRHGDGDVMTRHGDRALPFGLLDDERAPGQGIPDPVEARASCQACGPGWRTDPADPTWHTRRVLLRPQEPHTVKAGSSVPHCHRTATALAPSTRGQRRDRTNSPVRGGRRCRCLTGPDCASPTPAHYHAGERPAARAGAAGLALLTVRAAEGTAKVNRCRETAR